MQNSWDEIFSYEQQQPYYQELMNKLEQERKQYQIFPAKENVFKAFELCLPDKIKVVILGQDPYQTPGLATGLAFGFPSSIPPKKSLLNIFKELEQEYGGPRRQNSDLTDWAQQGVLLLNNVLTVRSKEADSHKGLGWETFTDHIFQYLNTLDQPVVFMLWGGHAQTKQKMLDNPKHLILTAAHPSPLSAYRGFLGCNHFIQANEFLQKHGQKPIVWQ